MKRLNIKKSGFARAVEEILEDADLETTKAIDNVEAVTTGDPAEAAAAQAADAEQKERLEAEAAALAAAGDPTDPAPGDPLPGDPAADPSADPAADPSSTEDPAAVTQDPTTPDANGNDAEVALVQDATAEVSGEIAAADASEEAPAPLEPEFAAECIDELTGNVDALSEASDLYSDVTNVKSTIEQSIPVGGFKPTDIEAVTSSINALLAPVGIQTPEEFGVGAEAFSPSRRIKSTKMAAESLEKVSDRVKQAILNFLKKIGEWITTLVKSIASFISTIGKHTARLFEDLGKASDAPIAITDDRLKVPADLAQHFSVNGQTPNVLDAFRAQASAIAFLTTFSKTTYGAFYDATQAIINGKDGDPYQIAFDHLNPSKLFVGWQQSSNLEGHHADQGTEFWVAKDVHLPGNKIIAASVRAVSDAESFVESLSTIKTFISEKAPNGEGLNFVSTKAGAQVLLAKFKELQHLNQDLAVSLSALQKREEMLNRLVEASVNNQTRQEPDVSHPSVTPSGHSSYENALYKTLVGLHNVVLNLEIKFQAENFKFETAAFSFIEKSIALLPKKSSDPDQRGADDIKKPE